jgi:hypothetical protein
MIAPVRRSIAPSTTEPAVIVTGVGFVQRSFLASLQVKAYGDAASSVTVAVLPPGFSICAQTTKFTLPSPSVSNSAQASPVWPVPAHSSVASQLHSSL